MIAGRTFREAGGVAVVAVALTVYFTWPLAPRAGSVGRSDSGDGQFSIWNVAWVAHAIISPDARVFDANIFHPRRGTLAYSEANLGAGVLAVPVYWLTRNPHAAHNSAVLACLTVSVIGMYLLALRLAGSRVGALAAAMVFTFCPHVFAHTTHIQLLMIAPLPFVFLALHAFVDRPAWPRAVLLGAAIAVQALFCAYYGVLAGLLAGLGVLFFAVSRNAWRQPRWWAQVALAAAVSVLLVLPFFLPYLQLQQDTGFGRQLDEARVYSANWRTYLVSDGWLHAWMQTYLGEIKEVLFPGFAAIAAGALGLVAGLKHRRETTIFYALVAALALWASFGPAAGLYTVLYKTLPIFSLLRAPARFGIAVSFGLAVLSAIGIAALLARLSARSALWAGGALLLFVLVDLSTPMPFVDVAPVPAAYRALANARPGAVAEFPFFYIWRDFFRHARYMLGSTAHWQPLVNGYSDYIPPDWAGSTRLLSLFPNQEGFEMLRDVRARYAVFHLGLYSARNRQALLHRIDAYGDALKPIVKDGDVWLFEIARWPETHPDLSASTPKAP